MTEEATGGLQPQYQTYSRQKCFVAYSEQAPWSVDLLSACEEVLSQPEYNLEADYARKHFAADVPLRQKALELIANARYGIYDLSYWRQDERSPWQMPRNVMIELGIAIALNRPILLLRHANNRDLPLPKGLQGTSDQILEFSGTTTLKKVLTEHLLKWINTTPETAWWNRYCTFGGRACSYREAHPKAKQFGKKNLACAIADGLDPCRPDFRSVVENILDRFDYITYTYLDSLSLKEGYSYLLCSHCQIVRSSPLAIYRITSETPVEAFISIGISLALEIQFEYKIPKILFAEDVHAVPSLLSGYEVFVASSDKERRACLKEFIPAVLTKLQKAVWKPRPLPFIEISLTTVNSDNNESQHFPDNESQYSPKDEALTFGRRRSLKVSSEGIAIVRQRLMDKVWSQKKLAEAAMVSRTTIQKFFDMQPIGRQIFMVICQTLDLNWIDVVSLDTHESQPASSQEQEIAPKRRRSVVLSSEEIELVREAFLRKGWSKAYLADAAMVSRTTIHKLLNGERIDRKTFTIICKVLELDSIQLSDLDDQEILEPEYTKFVILRTHITDGEVLIKTLTDLGITMIPV